MRTIVFLIFLANDLSAQPYRLAPPQIRCEQVFFEKNTEVRLFFDLKGATIQYTLDGSEPSEQSEMYRKPISIDRDVRLQARVFHPDYLPGESVRLDLFRRGTSPVPPLRLGYAPADEYGGAAGNYDRLIDGRIGSDDLHDGAWIGLQGKPLKAYAVWRDEQVVQSVKLSTLTNTGAWIFPPVRIQVFVAGEDAIYRMVQELSLPAPGDGTRPEEGRHTYIITFPPERCTRMRVEAIPWGALPSWHPGAGAQAWLFVDEIAFE